MRIAVLGASGQLGAAVVHEFSAGHTVIPFDHAALDITDSRKVVSEMRRVRPDAIVNCAAYNAVDRAEDEAVEALRANALAVRTLARFADESNSILVHYGSDFVFDGRASHPYGEQDRPNPRGVYAASKLLGEWFAADAPHAYVLRVESLFGRAPDGRPEKGSAAVIINALKSGTVVRVFADRTVTPTYVLDAAHATRLLVESGPARAPIGLYHCVNSDHCTWEEFAREAARLLGVEPRLDLIRLADARLKAERPVYCALSNAKLAALGIRMPTWRESLARYIRISEPQLSR
jgi:dTDP-4-dehydrorhamnose reductase